MEVLCYANEHSGLIQTLKVNQHKHNGEYEEEVLNKYCNHVVICAMNIDKLIAVVSYYTTQCL